MFRREYCSWVDWAELLGRTRNIYFEPNCFWRERVAEGVVRLTVDFYNDTKMRLLCERSAGKWRNTWFRMDARLKRFSLFQGKFVLCFAVFV